MLDLVQEEHVNASDRTDARVIDAHPHQLGDGIEPVVCSFFDIGEQIVDGHMLLVKLGHVQVRMTDFQRANGFEQAFFHGAAYAHHFAGGFHLRGQAIGSEGKLVKRKARQFRDNVIQRRFKAGGRIGEHDLMQMKTYGDFGRDAGNGISAGLGGERRGTRNTRIDFDHIVGKGLRIECKLHVAAALYAQRTNDLQRAVTEHVVFLIGQRLAGGDNNGIARMDADGIQILHRADGDRRVVCIAHDFKLNFLIALDALLKQHLMNRRERKGVFHHGGKFVVIAGKAAARTAERECGTQNDRIADFMRSQKCFLGGIGDAGGHDGFADARTQLFEKLTILCGFNAFGIRTQQLNAAFIKHPLFRQLHGEIQSGLPADAGNDRVRAFIAADARNVFKGQRLHVNLVCNGGVGHDGGRIGIGEDNLVSLFTQGKTCLRAGIVKFCCLTDDNRAGANHEHLADVGAFRHGISPPPSWI